MSEFSHLVNSTIDQELFDDVRITEAFKEPERSCYIEWKPFFDECHELRNRMDSSLWSNNCSKVESDDEFQGQFLLSFIVILLQLLQISRYCLLIIHILHKLIIVRNISQSRHERIIKYLVLHPELVIRHLQIFLDLHKTRIFILIHIFWLIWQETIVI